MLGCTPCRECRHWGKCLARRINNRPERFEVCELRQSLEMSCRSCIYSGECETAKFYERKKNNEKKRSGKQAV